ncbi:MAG: fibronectin type III domain-containing protein [Acidobacteriia bacterium]|nr:fibronectin type III domain-containing protein [Terriglobia bacterium]
MVDANAARFPIVSAPSANFARCLQSSGDAACFSGARPVLRVSTAGATAPGAPGTLTATSSGSSVTLTWSAPSSGDPVVTYLIEAGSASGLANLANFSTGSPATTFSAGGVPNGTYYVRIKAQNVAGTSAASNEATLVVGAASCASAPNAPSGLTSTVSGGTITLEWTAPSGGCAATSYVLQAGSAAGLSNLANADIGTTATRYVAAGVGAGSYYVRVLAANGAGRSAVSNEIVVTVGGLAQGAISVTVTPNPVPFSGTAIAAAACVGVPNTWFYTETIRETSGVAVTLTKWVSVRDGQSIINQGSVNSVIPARGTKNFDFNWCISGSGQHTIQTTWSGTDANGNSFSHVGPLVTLLASSTTTTTGGTRTFPAVWVNASWVGGRTGTPLSSKGIDPPSHFGALCPASSLLLENHPSYDPFLDLDFPGSGTLYATFSGCTPLPSNLAMCRTSGSGGGSSNIPTCSSDPRTTPASNVVPIQHIGTVHTPIGTATPINFDVNIFWCSDQSEINVFRAVGRLTTAANLDCVEK